MTSLSGRDFRFYVPFSKAHVDASGSVTLEGVASTTSVDYQNERVTLRCLKTMESQIKEKGMNLFLDHQHTIDKISGAITDCKVTDKELIIQARTTGTPNGQLLAQLVKDGVKVGLSVGGKIKVAEQTYDRETGKNVANIDDVILHEISAVGIAANPDTNITGWMAKSLYGAPGEGGDPPSPPEGPQPPPTLVKGEPAFDLLKLGRRPPRFPIHGSLKTGKVLKPPFMGRGIEEPEPGDSFTEKISRERRLHRLDKALALLKQERPMLRDYLMPRGHQRSPPSGASYPWPGQPGPRALPGKEEDPDALPIEDARRLLAARRERFQKLSKGYRRIAPMKIIHRKHPIAARPSFKFRKPSIGISHRVQQLTPLRPGGRRRRR